MPAPKTFVANIATNLHDVDAVKKKFDTLLKHPGVQALAGHLGEQGFKPAKKGKDAYFGATNTFKSNDGKTATFEFHLQSFAKAGSKDAAALGSYTVKSGDKSQTYHFTLVAPKGDFEKALEHTVNKAHKVRKANSWWSRWVNCLRSRCVSTCLGALATCSGTWAAYLWCVVAACGGCVLRCVGCASCNCRWWCRWAVGCCEG